MWLLDRSISRVHLIRTRVPLVRINYTHSFLTRSITGASIARCFDSLTHSLSTDEDTWEDLVIAGAQTGSTEFLLDGERERELRMSRIPTQKSAPAQAALWEEQ